MKAATCGTRLAVVLSGSSRRVLSLLHHHHPQDWARQHILSFGTSDASLEVQTPTSAKRQSSFQGRLLRLRRSHAGALAGWLALAPLKAAHSGTWRPSETCSIVSQYELSSSKSVMLKKEGEGLPQSGGSPSFDFFAFCLTCFFALHHHHQDPSLASLLSTLQPLPSSSFYTCYSQHGRSRRDLFGLRLGAGGPLQLRHASLEPQLSSATWTHSSTATLPGAFQLSRTAYRAAAEDRGAGEWRIQRGRVVKGVAVC